MSKSKFAHLITGDAGFIGSHVVECLPAGQSVPRSPHAASALERAEVRVT